MTYCRKHSVSTKSGFEQQHSIDLKMSDLATMVAAALRDKVVGDLNQEVKDLKEELEPWTFTITGAQGSPIYATGKLSLRDALTQSLDHPQRRICVQMQEGRVACPLEQFLECKVILTTTTNSNQTKTVTQFVDNGDVGNGIRAHNGIFEMGWMLDPDEIMEDVNVEIPIPNERLNHLDPALVEGIGVNREVALPIAHETTGRNAPICFKEIVIKSRALVAFLNEGDDDSSEDDSV